MIAAISTLQSRVVVSSFNMFFVCAVLARSREINCEASSYQQFELPVFGEVLHA